MKINRRDFLKLATTGAAGAILAASAQGSTAAPEAVEVEKEAKTEVEAAVLTPRIFLPAVLQGTLPRRETLIARILTGRVGTPDNFNGWVGWKWQDRGTQTLANEPLWSVDFATGQIINGSADGNPAYNANFTECTIKLRQGTTWSDGVPFTAADVVFTIGTLINFDGFNAHAFMVDNVASVTALDDYTVKFVLKQANSRFHTTFLDRWGCTWIMPKHIFEKEADPVSFKFNPFVGTGPYKLKGFDPAGSWTAWEKRQDWDKSPTGILYGEPQPKYIVYQSFDDESAQITAQLAHQLDVAELSADGLKALLAQSNTSRAYQPTFPYVVNNDPCITGICFNTARAPFDNVDVRWALALAIEIVEYTSIAVDSTGTLSPVHIPHLGPYPADYIVPLQDWLKAFTIDVGNGETFAPYDPDAPKRVADYARGRGYVFPDTPEFIAQAFGLGWYKYAPDMATKLLVKNGFSKNGDGKWLLPGGTPWKINFLCGTIPTNHDVRNAAAAVQQWQKFGIDAEMVPTDNGDGLGATGDFEVSSLWWPAQEPWGAGPDLYRVFDRWNSLYVKPIGEHTGGHYSRWSSPEMDAVIAVLRGIDPNNAGAVIAVGTQGLKLALQNMPGIPTYGYTGFVGWDQYHWTNWPGSENPYTQPYTHWGPFKYMTPRLRATGA